MTQIVKGQCRLCSAVWEGITGLAELSSTFYDISCLLCFLYNLAISYTAYYRFDVIEKMAYALLCDGESDKDLMLLVWVFDEDAL